MMKTKTYYEVTYSYNYRKIFDTDEEAKAWEEIYKTEFPDCRKWYFTDRITTKSFLFWKKVIKRKTIRKWYGEE